MTTHSSQVTLDERYLSPDTGSRFARTPLREGDPRWIGRYRLTARLGAGGMGVVYLGVAEDGRLVAVKIIRPELADNSEFLARFGREADHRAGPGRAGGTPLPGSRGRQGARRLAVTSRRALPVRGSALRCLSPSCPAQRAVRYAK